MNLENISKLRIKAEAGDAAAQYELGEIYFLGSIVPQNIEEGVIWYRRSAESGDARAQSGLGYMYYKGLFFSTAIP